MFIRAHFWEVFWGLVENIRLAYRIVPIGEEMRPESVAKKSTKKEKKKSN